MKRLQGKVALVTGAARGSGRAIARRFAEGGASVASGDLRATDAEQVAPPLGVGADVANSANLRAISGA